MPAVLPFHRRVHLGFLGGCALLSLCLGAVSVQAAAPAPATAASPTPGPFRPASSPFDREVAARRARFAKEAATPQSPAALVPLLAVSELWELVDDRAALVSLITDAARPRPGLLHGVRAQALFALRAVKSLQGDDAGALSAREELGLLRSFAFVGPFDNEGRRGHATVYAPEEEPTAPGPDKTYDGKLPGTALSWRPLPPTALGSDGAIPLDAWLRPETKGTAYAAIYVKSPELQRVAVRAGSTGAIKIWVNRGAPVIDRDLYRALRPDQEVAGAVLLPGWNRILVKLSSNDGPWSFLLRLTTPDGRAIAGLQTSAQPPSPGFAIPRAQPYAGPPPENLLTALRQRATRVPGNRPAERGQALLDLGIYLHYLQSSEPEQHEAEQVLGEAAALLRTKAAYRHLALSTSEVNERRKVVETGLAATLGDDEEQARLYLELGRLYQEAQRPLLAEPTFALALRHAPTLHEAAAALAEIQAGRGLLAEAERLVRAELLRHQAIKLERALADLLERQSRRKESATLYEHILTESHHDREAQRALLAQARGRGDVETALTLLERIDKSHPESVWPVRERIEILEGAGRFADALARLDAALGQFGLDPDWHQWRGRLLSRLGRSDEALKAYRRALELKPQNPTLRTYLSYIDPQARSGDDLARSFRIDVRELLGRPRPRPEAGDPARVLLDQQVTRVHKNGLSEVFTERVVEILDDRGVREYDDYEIRFTPDTQSVQIKVAKVYKQSGAVEQAETSDESDVSEPWYGLYYDVHAQTVRFPGLRPGDVIHLEYVLADVGRRNLLSDYFGDLHFLQEEIPRLDSRYVLVQPEAELQRRPLYWNTPRSDVVKVVRTDETTKEGDHVTRFQAQNVPRLLAEPGMPGLAEVIPYVHVSTYKSWEDVTIWYKGLVAEQLQPTPEITRAAHAAVAAIPGGKADDLAKMRAIYNFVVKKTRYVGLEFGIHGYKPYKVGQVFARKFGDCKDKASLLKVMLKEVGIDSTLVLARTRRSGAIATEPASLSVFDHAIVYVPKLDLYLDGTAEFSGSGELPSQDQDIMVLLVEDPRPPWNGRGHLTTTPVLPAEHSASMRRLDVQLEASGNARVREEHRVGGQPAERWREHYQSPGTQKERYEKAWNESYPGAKVLRVELPGLADLEKPVLLRGEAEVPAWGRPGDSAAQLVLRPLGRDPDLLRSFGRLSQRRFDLIIGFPWLNEEQVTVTLGAGQKVGRLPSPRRIESPFGSFALTAEQHGNVVTVRAELKVKRHRLTREEYPAFRRFCAEVDSAVAQELVVNRE